VFNNSNVSAASAGNFFHFTEHSVITTKSNVLEKHLLRLETHANYTANPFNKEYRLLKKDDNELEEMLFVAVKKEKI
jgi:cyclase